MEEWVHMAGIIIERRRSWHGHGEVGGFSISAFVPIECVRLRRENDLLFANPCNA